MVHATELFHFSKTFHKFYDRQFSPLLRETGLTMREIHVLLFLINNPGYDTARDVTEYRGLVKSQVSQAVELLFGLRLLDRTPDASDRRIVRLTLTEKGLALARRAQALQLDCYRRLFSGFTAQEEETFHQLLARVLQNGESLDSTQSPS